MNKVVVIAPKELDDFFEILSFHKALEAYYKELDFTVIVKNVDTKLVNFLLKPIRLIVRENSDFGLLESIRYANKLKDVFNVTHVFNLDTSLGSISFSKSLKPKECFGVKSQLTNLFYTKEFEKSSLINMLDYITENKVERGFFYEDSSSSNTENFFKAPTSDPFLLLAINEFNNESFSLVSQLLSSFKEKRVILWSSRGDSYAAELVSAFPTLVNASEVGEELLYRYIAAAFGIITDRADISRLSNYFLKENFYLTKENAFEASPLMINKTVSIIESSGNYLLDYSNGESERKDNSDNVISIILSLLND